MKSSCEPLLPVIIPARNEEVWLRRTLSRLPPSRATPIVVVNGSTDKSMETAISFGAVTIQSEPGKMLAIQAGFRRLGFRALGPVAILDADATPLLPTYWASTMKKALQSPVSGVAYIDLCLAARLDQMFVHSARFARLAQRALQGASPHTGPNMGVHLDEEGLDTVLSMPNYWPGEDRAIADSIIQQGGTFARPVNLGMTVLTRTHSDDYNPFLSLRAKLTHDKTEVMANYAAAYAARAPEGSIPYVSRMSI